MRKTSRLLLPFIVLTLLLVAAAAVHVALIPISLPREQVEFTLTPGSNLRTAAREIAASEVGIEPWVLIALARLLGVETSIKAGSYQISRGTTPLELLRKLTRGDFTQAELAFIEGWTFRQMRQRLDAHPDLRHETSGLSEGEIMRLLGAPEMAAEGAFFPDTYLFAKRSSDLELLARAHRAMQRHLQQQWQARADHSPLRDPYQALILASIIEKRWLRRRPAQARPDRRHTVQHLRPSRPATHSDRHARTGFAAGGAAPGNQRRALLRRPR